MNVTVRTEREFYADQSRILIGLIKYVGTTIAVLMGIGAIFAALNTMYSAVSSRTREIATLRALGFGATPVIASVLLEAATLGLLGGIVGGVLVYFGVEWLPGHDAQLGELQPDHVCLHRDAAAAGDGSMVFTHTRNRRRPAAWDPGRQNAGDDGTEGTLAWESCVEGRPTGPPTPSHCN